MTLVSTWLVSSNSEESRSSWPMSVMFRVAASLVRREGRQCRAPESFSSLWLSDAFFTLLMRDRSSSRSFRAASRVIFFGDVLFQLPVVLTLFVFSLTMMGRLFLDDLRRVLDEGNSSTTLLQLFSRFLSDGELFICETDWRVLRWGDTFSVGFWAFLTEVGLAVTDFLTGLFVDGDDDVADDATDDVSVEDEEVEELRERPFIPLFKLLNFPRRCERVETLLSNSFDFLSLESFNLFSLVNIWVFPIRLRKLECIRDIPRLFLLSKCFFVFCGSFSLTILGCVLFETTLFDVLASVAWIFSDLIGLSTDFVVQFVTIGQNGVLKMFKDSGSSVVPRKQRNVTKSSVLGQILGKISLMIFDVEVGGGSVGRLGIPFSLSLWEMKLGLPWANLRWAWILFLQKKKR